MGYNEQAIIGVKVPNSSHVACIQHGRASEFSTRAEKHTKTQFRILRQIDVVNALAMSGHIFKSTSRMAEHLD